MISLDRIDTQWTFFQKPYVFEDALGRKYPIASEYNFELIQAIIKEKFLGMPGYRQVLLGNYELFKTQNARESISVDTYLPPGSAITMAILLNAPDTTSTHCPMPQCRSTRALREERGGTLWSVRTSTVLRLDAYR